MGAKNMIKYLLKALKILPRDDTDLYEDCPKCGKNTFLPQGAGSKCVSCGVRLKYGGY